ncbi:hypothetical protein AAHE18_01G130100 [Arachis hypogaea]
MSNSVQNLPWNRSLNLHFPRRQLHQHLERRRSCSAAAAPSSSSSSDTQRTRTPRGQCTAPRTLRSTTSAARLATRSGSGLAQRRLPPRTRSSRGRRAPPPASSTPNRSAAPPAAPPPSPSPPSTAPASTYARSPAGETAQPGGGSAAERICGRSSIRLHHRRR